MITMVNYYGHRYHQSDDIEDFSELLSFTQNNAISVITVGARGSPGRCCRSIVYRGHADFQFY